MSGFLVPTLDTLTKLPPRGEPSTNTAPVHAAADTLLVGCSVAVCSGTVIDAVVPPHCSVSAAFCAKHVRHGSSALQQHHVATVWQLDKMNAVQASNDSSSRQQQSNVNHDYMLVYFT
jgi:hypothetical protein